MGRCQEEGGDQRSVSNLCNLYSTCRKTFTQIQIAEKKMESEKKIHLNKQQRSTNKDKGWKDGSYYSYIPLASQFLQSMKNCPRQIKNHKTPEGQKLTKTKRRFASVQWQNRRVLPLPEWLRLTWKGMKRLEKFALWGRQRAVPLGGARVSTVICCLLLSGRRWNRGMELAPPATFCLAESSLRLLPMD